MARLVVKYQDEEVLEVKAGDDIELSFQAGLCELVDGMDSEEFDVFLWDQVKRFIERHEAPDGVNYGDNAQRMMGIKEVKS